MYQRSKGQRLYKQQVNYEMQLKNKYEKRLPEVKIKNTWLTKFSLLILITNMLGSGSMNFYIDGTMPQAGIDPPAQSRASNEASALLPSHHGWMVLSILQ